MQPNTDSNKNIAFPGYLIFFFARGHAADDELIAENGVISSEQELSCC
tara:strand:- start:478 stop:621 length:144 start_codon:yes stop_codon:yes gene_type:complete